MGSTVNLKAVGLNFQPNPLELPPGSLTEASNVIIRRDDVLESRRGYKIYGNSFGTSTDRTSQLAIYKGRILRHYGSTLQFDTGSTNTSGVNLFSSFSGSFSPTEAGLRIKSIESNGNFYFTTSDGIKKISAASTADFSTASGYITQAGGVKAIDASVSVNYNYASQTDFFTQDSIIAYRVLWGIKDANSNLILGAPSQRVEVYNSLLTLLLQDFHKVLQGLDYCDTTGCLIDDGNYINTEKLPSSAAAGDLHTKLLDLATKIDTDILLANDSGTDGSGNSILNVSSATAINTTTVRITVSAGNPLDYVSIGSKVRLSGFGVGSVSSVSINNAYTLTDVQAGYIEFTQTGLTLAETFSIPTGLINYNEFRSITQPTVPSIPTTDAQLVALQTYLDSIIQKLQFLPNAILPTSQLNDFILPLDITTSATTTLKIRIPDAITDSYFYQIYRTAVNPATDTTVLTDLGAGDEMQLVLEGFPTPSELSAKEVVIEDITPDSFRGANLYTNPTSGEGILQANDNIPAAKDINKFNNYTFYANTRTRHFKLLNLLGVANMIEDYNNTITPKLTIANTVTSNTYSFIIGIQEVTQVTCIADVADSLNGDYFVINSANDDRSYYVWFKTSGGAVSDPTVSGKIGVRVNVDTGSAASVVATKVRDALNSLPVDFSASASGSNCTVTNVGYGYTTDATAGTSGFTISVLTQGQGENASNKEVLLSTNTSPAIAVDETAKSLVRVINKNASEDNYAYYISGVNDIPGKMQIEARSLDTNIIYFLTNNDTTGASFNPDISGTHNISTISVANPTQITTSTAHGLANADYIVISNSNSTPNIDGVHQITYVDSTNFTINVNVTVVGSAGVIIKTRSAEQSTNEEKSNRIYYSKLQQPEAVPALNYVSVGTEDDEIYRIMPLRDSLFVFKKNGLYRLSGDVAPFSVSLFDSSTSLLAPDSLGIADNTIYGWTDGGISTISEAGASVISRPIDTDILKLASSQYTNFKTSTWGIGYESDNSYTVYTVSKPTDTHATIGYRYCTLTYSWTTFDKSPPCGVLNPTDDKMYLGCSDLNFIEQERKDYTRYDYADREYNRELTFGNYIAGSLRLSDITNLSIGDVITQEQTITAFEFNGLLRKLDLDVGVGDTNYYSTLKANGGDNIKTDLLVLATKLDVDSGVNDADYNSTIIQKTGSITSNTAASPTIVTTSIAHGLFSGRIVTISGSNCSPSIDGVYEITVLSPTTYSIPVAISTPGTAGTWTTLDSDFRDLKACYNKIIQKLNADTGVSYSNYVENDYNTLQEAVVTGINKITKVVDLNIKLDFIVGSLKTYEAIDCTFTYAPQHFGDVLSLKQIREGTIMFINKAFTNATLSFASDLVPQFYDTEFNGDGSGIFGHQPFGEKFFGGGSNAAPFRTYIPRNTQRCRYIVCKFSHRVAREQFGVVGVSLTGEVTSGRAYR